MSAFTASKSFPVVFFSWPRPNTVLNSLSNSHPENLHLVWCAFIPLGEILQRKQDGKKKKEINKNALYHGKYPFQQRAKTSPPLSSNKWEDAQNLNPVACESVIGNYYRGPRVRLNSCLFIQTHFENEIVNVFLPHKVLFSLAVHVYIHLVFSWNQESWRSFVCLRLGLQGTFSLHRRQKRNKCHLSSCLLLAGTAYCSVTAIPNKLIILIFQFNSELLVEFELLK